MRMTKELDALMALLVNVNGHAHVISVRSTGVEGFRLLRKEPLLLLLLPE